MDSKESRKAFKIANRQTVLCGNKKAKRRLMKAGSRHGLPKNLSKSGGFRTYDQP